MKNLISRTILLLLLFISIGSTTFSQLRCRAGRNCTISCPAGCGCIYVRAERKCYCSCDRKNTVGDNTAIYKNSKVDISIHGNKLEELLKLVAPLYKSGEVELPLDYSKYQDVNYNVSNVTFAKFLTDFKIKTKKVTKSTN